MNINIFFQALSGMSLDYLFLSFMIYSFGGWLFETTIISLWESGHFLNWNQSSQSFSRKSYRRPRPERILMI